MDKVKIVLCDEKLPNVSIYVIAELINGKLKISGQDTGNACNACFGDSDYEYFYDFSAEDTNKFFVLLNKKTEAIDFLYILKEQFNGVNACRKLRDFCDENNIKYSFSTY